MGHESWPNFNAGKYEIENTVYQGIPNNIEYKFNFKWKIKYKIIFTRLTSEEQTKSNKSNISLHSSFLLLIER